MYIVWGVGAEGRESVEYPFSPPGWQLNTTWGALVNEFHILMTKGTKIHAHPGKLSILPNADTARVQSGRLLRVMPARCRRGGVSRVAGPDNRRGPGGREGAGNGDFLSSATPGISSKLPQQEICMGNDNSVAIFMY